MVKDLVFVTVMMWGHCCGSGLIPGMETSTCCKHGPENLKKKTIFLREIKLDLNKKKEMPWLWMGKLKKMSVLHICSNID